MVNRTYAGRIMGAYLLFGILWILLSDTFVGSLDLDEQMDFILAANCSLDRKQQARFTFSLVVDRVARISTMENIIGFESLF